MKILESLKQYSHLSDKQLQSKHLMVQGGYKGKENGKVFSKPVIQYDKQGNLINEYPSIQEASRITNINRKSIRQACKGELKTAGKFIWQFKN